MTGEQNNSLFDGYGDVGDTGDIGDVGDVNDAGDISDAGDAGEVTGIVPLDMPDTRSPLESPSFDDLVRPVALKRRRPPVSTVVAAAVAAVLVVVMIVVLVVVRPFAAVRSSDYTLAAQRTATMAKQYRNTSAAIDEALKFLYTQGSSYDEAKVKALRTQAAKFHKSVDAFGDLRVVKDEKVSAAYDTYATQAKHFATLSTNLADSVKPLSAMVQACGQAPSGTMYDTDFTSKYEQYISTCRTAAVALDDAKAQVVSEFAASLVQNLDQMSSIITQMNEIGSPSQYSTSSEQGKLLQDLSSQLVDLDTSYGAINTFQEQLRQTRENADPTALLNKLDTAIQQGYEGK